MQTARANRVTFWHLILPALAGLASSCSSQSHAWTKRATLNANPVRSVPGVYSNRGRGVTYLSSSRMMSCRSLLWSDLAGGQSTDETDKVKIEITQQGHLKLSLISGGNVTSKDDIGFTVEGNALRVDRRRSFESNGILTATGHSDVWLGTSKDGLELFHETAGDVYLLMMPISADGPHFSKKPSTSTTYPRLH